MINEENALIDTRISIFYVHDNKVKFNNMLVKGWNAGLSEINFAFKSFCLLDVINYLMKTKKLTYSKS